MDNRVTIVLLAFLIFGPASKSGAESVERGRYVDVQKKIDGRWQYIVDHPSDEPAPAAPVAK